TSWIGRDLGDAVVQTRRLEPPRATSPNDVDRRRDRRAVDVRRLRATDDFRRAERLPHPYAQLLYDFVDLGHIKTVPARRPPNERIESTDDVLECLRCIGVGLRRFPDRQSSLGA